MPAKILNNFDELSKAIISNDQREIASAITAGLNVNGTDISGRTLLMCAVEEGRINIVELLISAGAKLNLRDRLHFHADGGKTALHRAAQLRYTEIARILLRSGAKVDVADKSALTPLQLAVQNGDVGMTKILLDAGANQNGIERRPTPLSDAAVMGYREIVTLLLGRGANPNHPADARMPPLTYAVLNSDIEICQLLLQAGARVDVIDGDGKTAVEVIPTGTIPLDVAHLGLSEVQMDQLKKSVENAREIRRMLLEAGTKEKVQDKSK